MEADGMSGSSWLQRAVSPSVRRRSTFIALVVGPILTAINQGDFLFSGQGLDWTKVVLTFVVPYVVATLGALGGHRDATAPCQAETPPLVSRPPAESGDSSVKARVHVTLKPGVLDPQGKAIEQALAALGFTGVEGVRQGKVIELDLAAGDPEAAHSAVREMCEKLLANTVIENYAIELDG
jgi:phosphoribosylformylglycinamidine synthase